jgi:hypothetical protein
MIRSKNARLLALAACVGTTGSVAFGQADYSVTLSGATLLQNFIRDPLSTVDVIDVNGDGLSRTGSPAVTQQLVFRPGSNNPADLDSQNPSAPNQNYWVVQYRSVGSVNGVRDIARYGRPNTVSEPATGPLMDWRRTETVSWQHLTFIDNSQTSPIIAPSVFNSLNPSGLPNRTVVSGPFPNSYPYVSSTLTTGAIQVDIAPVDVPTLWATRGTGVGSPNPTKKPGQAEYGSNTRIATDKNGTPLDSGNELNRFDLVDLDAEGRNLNITSPDSNTIFDTAFTFAPIAAYVNIATGKSDFEFSELRHLMATGRLPSGENLTAVTRSVGSGTHNGFMNSIGLDPSFGVGESIGPESTPPNQHMLGDEWVPGNAQGSGLLETKLLNARLGVGYSGAERGVNSNTVVQRRFDFARVRADGGTDFVRAEVNKIINNGLRGQTDPDGGTYSEDGWRIGGPAVLATLGDPRSAPVNKGGDAANTNPDMNNVEAAAYVNNITRAIAILAATPTCPLPPAAQRGPAERLVTGFVLLDATDRIQEKTATTANPTNWVINPANTTERQALADLYLNCADALGVYRNALYSSTRAANPEYQSPRRKAAAQGWTTNYSDNRIESYRTLGNTNVSYNTRMDALAADIYERNRIAGDFDGNGLRNGADLPEMMQALRLGFDDTRASGTWDGGDVEGGTISAARGLAAVPEMLGDHNGDGNFDAKDVRYAADGLATYSGSLNRKQGFIDADSAWEALTGNFFWNDANGGGTTSVRCSYKAGDARADIAGAPGTTPGFAPVGSDGAVNAADIDYVFAQIAPGDVNWATNLAGAARADLSADINGDLVLDRNDVTEILSAVLCTRWWDVNLDGVVNETDRTIAQSHVGQAGGWAQGDVDGDGQITSADVTLICPADFNGDGQSDFFDYLDFAAAFDAETCSADFNGDCQVDFFDYLDFVAAFDVGC